MIEDPNNPGRFIPGSTRTPEQLNRIIGYIPDCPPSLEGKVQTVPTRGFDLADPTKEGSITVQIVDGKIVDITPGKTPRPKTDITSLINVASVASGRLVPKPSYITPPIEGSPVPSGRNEPCLCGSGKKYKKCCFKQAPLTVTMVRKS